MRKSRSADSSFLLALAIAIAAHGGRLIAYRAVNVVEPPRLVLPVGWAAEFEGSGEQGATLVGFDTSIDAVATSESPAPTPALPGPPPTDVEPPSPTAQPVRLDASAGTNALAEFATVSSG